MRCLLLLLLLSPLALAEPYFPSRHDWQTVTPSQAGINAEALDEAIAFARSEAQLEPKNLHRAIYESFAPREPDFRILGPTKPREGDAGMILRGGKIVAEWGDVQRVDMTFSVVKSYLATTWALAWRDGLIQNLDERVGDYVRDGKFDSEHNAPITWRHLLNQTSDWSGTLWGVPDWADRPVGDDPAQWPNRELHAPGTHYKYNDVRVNLAAYSVMQVLREPLPVALKREIMDPIGASTTWRWYGYDNSWIELDGLRMQSVSGGGHFGGGLFINTRDHARFGLLMQHRGVWDGERLLPDEWFTMLREPTPVRPDYGLMWWLNTDQARIPSAPESAYWAAGFGGNYIYVDECNELLIVLRWIPALEDVVAKVMQAIEEPVIQCEAA